MSPFINFLTKSFYVRMILVMLAISIIPLLLLSYISIAVSSTTVESQVNRLNAQLVNQVVDRIELTMSRFRELSEQYSHISSIQSALVSPSAHYFDDVVRKKDLISVLSTASAVIGNVEGLQVYSAITGEVLSSVEAPASLDSSPYKPLIEHFLAAGTSGMFLDKSSMPGLDILQNSTYYIGRIPFEPYEELKGVLLISMSNEQYQRQIENIQLGSKGSISLLTQDGVTLATTSKLSRAEDEQRIRTILRQWSLLGKPNQFGLDASIISVKQTGTFDKWIVISEIPSRELTQSAGIIRRTVTYFLAVLVAVGALSVFGFGYYLYRPLQAVRRQVEALKKGHFDARVSHFANNEIGELGRMLNSMAVRIQDLLADQQESEELKRRLEIRALQSQINPHFMYNTLNTIRMFAMLKDYDKINTIMGRLVSLLRYSMENYDQTVPLQHELVYLEDYIGLLNMRYKCQIELHVEVEEPLRGMLIPKLSFQPLIENSVYHGILPKKAEDGHIRIQVYGAGEYVVIDIGDDGIGMGAEELERLKGHILLEESGENIGLHNVYMRMQLVFGKDVQTELSSTPAAGMRIRFLLPQDRIRVKEAPHEQL